MFEKFQDKAFWQGVRNNPNYQPFIDALKQRYNENKTNPIPVLKYSDYQAYEKIGVREAYEFPYFTRRRYLASSAVLALIYPENEEYFTAVQDLIFAVCGEWAWAVPAHTIDAVNKPETTMIDLFASETALALAEIFVFLKDRLDKNVKELIISNLQKRIVEPLNTRKFWWEWATNNWTIVCGGNVGSALMHLFPEVFEKHKDRFLQCAKQFIDAFPDDGTCLEGFSYWHFGFGNFVWFADCYYEYTNGKQNLFDNKKVETISDYASRSFLFGDTTVSIADGVRTGRADKTMLHYLSKRYPNSVQLLPEDLMHIWSGNVSWVQTTRTFFYVDPTRKANAFTLKNHDLLSSGQVIVHGENYSLFAKAGHNDEPHNHNDVGSFILADQSGQVFIDYGASRYTKESFGPNRYAIFSNSSRGHSLPIINGQEQKPGKNYNGTISHDHEKQKITVEFGAAYGLKNLKRATRVFDYGKNQVIITDTFEGDIQDVKERFITLTKPIVKEGEIELGKVIFRFDPTLKPTILEEEIAMHGRMKTFANGQKDCETVYTIEFPLRGQTETSFTIIVK